MKQLLLCLMGCVSLIASDFQWMDTQIDNEFKTFKHLGITPIMLDSIIWNIPNIGFGHALRRFQIINRIVYGPPGGPKGLLEKIAQLYPVPDVDVILLDQDIIWNHWVLTGPVLATCKIAGTSEKMIHFPLQLWNEWETNFVPNVEEASNHSPWEAKIPKIFWRGYNTDADHYNDPDRWTQIPRGKLCYLSQQTPTLIDAAFSGTHEHLVRPDLRDRFFTFFPQKNASWAEYLSYKYLIDLDGYVASTPGCAWKLLTNCAVIKQETPFTLWYYTILVPWVHYIPVKRDLSDLFEKLAWARTHDAEVQKIAENGRAFAKENLMPEHLYLYCYKVLCKYASLQRFKPVVRSQ